MASFVFSFNSDRFPTLPLGDFTTEWYQRAFSRPELWQAIANSLMVAGCTAVLSTFIGFATAYTDFRYGFRFKQAYLALALLPLACLLGRGDKRLLGLGLSGVQLDPLHTVVLGPRSWEPEEAAAGLW